MTWWEEQKCGPIVIEATNAKVGRFFGEVDGMQERSYGKTTVKGEQ